MGRFINADGYATTGQGLLGNNMFAYCNSNPVNSSDPTGRSPILDGYIHREVLKEICNKNGQLSYTQTCVRYRDANNEYTGKWGFCDLYNKITGEVWELKKKSNSRSCQTENALKQLDNYVKGTLLWNPALELKKPNVTEIPSSMFTVKDRHVTYNVTYWDEGNGILRYSYTVSPNKENIAQSVAIIGIAVAGYAAMGIPGLVAGFSSGLGGLCPA